MNTEEYFFVNTGALSGLNAQSPKQGFVPFFVSLFVRLIVSLFAALFACFLEQTVTKCSISKTGICFGEYLRSIGNNIFNRYTKNYFVKKRDLKQSE